MFLNILHQIKMSKVQNHYYAKYLKHILLYLCWHCHNFEHFILILSIHGLCNSKSGPSGSSEDESTISFLENNAVCFPQSLQFHIGSGHPQNLSLEIHQGCFSLIIPKNRFFGWSKKYSTFSAAFTALSS